MELQVRVHRLQISVHVRNNRGQAQGQMLILAIDVGIRNIAHCAMENGRVVAWANEPLCDGNYAPADTVRHVMAYVRRHKSLLDAADKVVIERQMRVNMRVVEAALHALFYDKCAVVHARSVKQRYGLCKRNYRLNKQAAVRFVETLLAERPECPWTLHFDASRKRDDLADAYVMALFFSEQHSSAGGRCPAAASSASHSTSPSHRSPSPSSRSASPSGGSSADP